jgi:hypothetical protein
MHERTVGYHLVLLHFGFKTLQGLGTLQTFPFSGWVRSPKPTGVTKHLIITLAE